MAENNPQPPATNGARPRPPPGRRPNTGNPLRPMRRGPRPPPRPGQPKPAAAAAAPAEKTEQDIAERRKQSGGWLDPPPPGCSDIPIMTTKKALLDGIRHHMLKFASKPGQVVDPTDQDEFARPVTLHRRDPRQPPPGRAVKEEPIPEPEPKSVDQEEQDRLAQIKADKEAQRAIDQAKIAPVIKDNQPKKPKKAKEDKITFNRAPKTEAAKKESEIRYEEALPWHLEDADGKNVWVGSYVSALSETTVALTIDGGVFRMVPIEKWYRMASKPPFEAYTIEMVENIMGKKTLESRWAKRDQERKEAEGDMEFTRRMFYGKGPMIKTESDTFKAASRSEKLDHDDLDVSGDEFQDDDEQPTLERQDDEDTKETNERIKREQREANNFGEGDEQELEKELKAQLKEQLDRQKYGKKLKKKLLKNQDNVYDESESDEKPWTSSSESESDDEEEEEEKKEGENGVSEKDNAASQNSADRDKEKTSGSSTKGTNTPKKLNTKSLKRAGSPSESSGNESVRKKAKTKKTAVGASGASASARGSRAGTPVSAGAQRRHLGAGSGSDGEATAGEMSDGAGGVKKNKIKLVGSNRGTPSVSRQGSPAPVAGGASPAPSAPTVTAKEILDVLPEDGLNIRDLMAAFKSRIGSGPGQIDRAEFVGMVKNVCAYGQDKKLRRRAAGTAKSPSA